MLTAEQVAAYERDGFLVLRGQIAKAELQRLERGVARNPPLDGTLQLQKLRFPEPGRYTLANQCLKDPDLAFVAEHPNVVSAAAELLGDAPRLTAYVVYDRTPGGFGSAPAQ